MSGTIRMNTENRFVRYCDFCGKTENEAHTLIAAPNGPHICDECVDICAEVVAEQRKIKGEAK